MKVAYIAVLFLLGSVLSVASNIAGGNPDGTALTTSGNVFIASTIWDNVNGATGGAISGGPQGINISTTITATFAGGGTATCTFVGGSCTSSGVTLTAPTGDTVASQWSLQNNSGNTITAVTISLNNGAFNFCPGAPSSLTCSSGTAGAGFGRGVSGDGTGVNATVAYTNVVQLLGVNTPTSDLYTQISFSFNGATQFTTGSTFTFWGDTDLTPVGSPEPATVSLVGLALVGLVTFRKRLR